MSKHRILIISPYMFSLPTSGGKILMYNHARSLSQFYDVEIITPEIRKIPKDSSLPSIDQFCKVHYIDLQCHQLIAGPESWLYILRNYPRAVFMPYPIVDIYDFYNHPYVQALIKDDFDVIQLNHSWWYHFALKQRRCKLLYVSHNCEYEYWRGMALALMYQKKYFRGGCYWFGSGKIFDQEKEAINEADCVLALSQRERKIFEDAYGLKDNCHVINPGIDIASYQSLPDNEPAHDRESLSLVYVGSFNNAPQNVGGVISFIKEVYPLVKKRLPLACRLYLVGADPVFALQQLAKNDPSIILTGFVDDVKPWIKKSDIYIVPLAHGSGIRFKIMEAMAIGKPIVSTKKGSEGLNVGNHGIIIVDDINGFVSAILNLAQDRQARLRMGQDNATFARDHFDCEKIFRNEILPIYQSLIKT